MAIIITFILVTAIMSEVVAVSTGMFITNGFRERQNYLYGFKEPDPVLGIRPKPNLDKFTISWSGEDSLVAFSTDSYGFRNVGRNYQDSKVYFVGDSYTFGYWIERGKSFVGLIEKKLGEPVISLSGGGYGFRQYKILIERFLDEFQPQLFVLCVYANDLNSLPSEQDLKNYYKFMGYDKFKVVSYRQKSILGQLVSFFRMVRTIIRDGLPVATLDSGITLYKHWGADPNYLYSNQYLEVEKNLLEIIDITKKNNVELIIFLLPSKESVYKQDYQRLFGAKYLMNEELGYQRLCHFAGKNGIRCIDLTPVFRARAAEKCPYIKKGVHWNDIGNEIAAESMLPSITASLKKSE
jgi:lysophospholipase L1-like esterase